MEHTLFLALIIYYHGFSNLNIVERRLFCKENPLNNRLIHFRASAIQCDCITSNDVMSVLVTASIIGNFHLSSCFVICLMEDVLICLGHKSYLCEDIILSVDIKSI